MRNTCLFIFTIFFCIALQAQTTIDSTGSLEETIEPYNYDTILKGGYTIYFKVDDELEYIYLKKGKKIITELSSCSKGLPYKNLGYVASDFKDLFVLAHSFGSGNPTSIELIQKSTGKNTIEKGAAWIDAVVKKEILLYCTNDVPSPKDKMILHNIKTRQKQFFTFPNDIFKEPQVLNRIKIVSISEKQFVFEYETGKGEKRKKYNR